MKVTALTVLALLLATSAQAAEKPSQSFLKKAIQGNYAELEMGKLAQQNGQSDNVKNFGQCLYKERVRYRDAKGCCSLEIY